MADRLRSDETPRRIVVLCRPRWLSIAVAGCCALLLAGKLQAAPPSEQLLPATTKGYVSVGDVDRFRADWAKTQIGQLLADPIMQPFVEDFKQQLWANGIRRTRSWASPGTTCRASPRARWRWRSSCPARPKRPWC